MSSHPHPYAELLVDMYKFPKQRVDVIANMLTENDHQVLEEAIAGLKNKASGERKQTAVYRSYGIGCESVSLKEIAASYEPPVTGGRAAEMRRTAWRHMRTMPVLRPLVQRLVDAGLEGQWTHITLRLPTPVELDAVNGVDDAQSPDLAFSGQFLFDCLPTCTPEEQCPTCKAKALLQAHGLTEQFDELMGGWQTAIGLGWQMVDIDSLGYTFSVRTANCFKNENIRTLGDLCAKSEWELLRTPYFGRKSLNEVKSFLRLIGRSLKT